MKKPNFNALTPAYGIPYSGAGGGGGGSSPQLPGSPPPPTSGDVRRFYMNQSDTHLSSMRFGTTTIGVSGCGILSIAMIISRDQNISDQAGQVAIVQAVINSALYTGNQNLLARSSTISINGVTYNVSRSTTRPANFNNTIIQYPTHFVLAVNNDLVKDAGARTVTTVADADAMWGQQSAWWSVH